MTDQKKTQISNILKEFQRNTKKLDKSQVSSVEKIIRGVLSQNFKDKPRLTKGESGVDQNGQEYFEDQIYWCYNKRKEDEDWLVDQIINALLKKLKLNREEALHDTNDARIVSQIGNVYFDIQADYNEVNGRNIIFIDYAAYAYDRE